MEDLIWIRSRLRLRTNSCTNTRTTNVGRTSGDSDPGRYSYAPVARDQRETATRKHRHGRLEVCYVAATAELWAVGDWPHLVQAFMVSRSWRANGQVAQDIHYRAEVDVWQTCCRCSSPIATITD